MLNVCLSRATMPSMDIINLLLTTNSFEYQRARNHHINISWNINKYECTHGNMQQSSNSLVVSWATVCHTDSVHTGPSKNRVFVAAQTVYQGISFLHTPVHGEGDTDSEPTQYLLMLGLLGILKYEQKKLNHDIPSLMIMKE